MFSASGRFAWPALVNKLSRVCFAARCSEQLRLAGCFLPFSLILLSVNTSQFWWVRLGSRWRRAKVDCRAAEVMKSSAVFIHCLVIRPPQPPARTWPQSHRLAQTRSHSPIGGERRKCWPQTDYVTQFAKSLCGLQPNARCFEPAEWTRPGFIMSVTVHLTS